MSQTTLDDVFIHFANQQSDEADVREGAGSDKATPTTTHVLPDIVPNGHRGQRSCEDGLSYKYSTLQQEELDEL